MKSLREVKNIVTRKTTAISVAVVGFAGSVSATAINWTEGKENVEGAMDLFIAFVGKVPEIIMYLFIVIVMLGIAYAIKKFANNIGNVIKI